MQNVDIDGLVKTAVAHQRSGRGSSAEKLLRPAFSIEARLFARLRRVGLPCRQCGGGIGHVDPRRGPANNTITAVAVAEDANHTVTSSVVVSDAAPRWDLTPAPAHTPQNNSVTFHWSGYGDAGGDGRTGWTVDWGDGNTATLGAGANDIAHSYAAAGAYTATLSAVDGDGTHGRTMAFNMDDSDARGSNPNDELSFDLQQGMLVANYDDDNGDGVVDYEETDPVSAADDDLYKMNLYIPTTFTSSDSVTLGVAGANIYDSSTKDHLIGAGFKVWGDATTVPQDVYLEVTVGSAAVDDFYTSINGAGQNFCQNNTAVNLRIIGTTDPNSDIDGQGPITDSERLWMVGQVVDEYIEVDAPAQWTANLTYNWHVPGNILRDYVEGGQVYNAGTADYYTDEGYGLSVGDDDLGNPHTGYKQNDMRFFWVSTSNANDLNAVSIGVGNINGATLVASSKYNVYRPNADLQIEQGVVSTEPFNGRVIGLIIPGKNYGMEFTGKVSVPSMFQQGSWNFLQLWRPDWDSLEQGANDPLQNGLWFYPYNLLWGLDNDLPYVTHADVYTDGAFATAPFTTSHKATDYPHLGADDFTARVRIEHRFDMYLMFRPPGDSGNTRFVPLLASRWQFSALATLANKNADYVIKRSAQSKENARTVTAEPSWAWIHINGTQWNHRSEV